MRTRGLAVANSLLASIKCFRFAQLCSRRNLWHSLGLPPPLLPLLAAGVGLENVLFIHSFIHFIATGRPPLQLFFQILCWNTNPPRLAAQYSMRGRLLDKVLYTYLSVIHKNKKQGGR